MNNIIIYDANAELPYEYMITTNNMDVRDKPVAKTRWDYIHHSKAASFQVAMVSFLMATAFK